MFSATVTAYQVREIPTPYIQKSAFTAALGHARTVIEREAVNNDVLQGIKRITSRLVDKKSGNAPGSNTSPM